ncbi:MAG TPA: prepilin-type N-terminal cleavage/methylation domain-containing protein [Candidatus Binataceae bacterium]|nr:prepilin-type N-terminal cleavage/methylation domain-containing protein [Candidatus Binataceae bacterium]
MHARYRRIRAASSSRRYADSLRGARAQAQAQNGFTLLELAIVLFIMALMFTLAVPYMGSYREAQLKSEARRMAGRASYLYDEAASQKVVLRMIFDLDHQRYAVARLDPYSPNPQFVADHSMAGRMIVLPPAVGIRDVTVADLGTFNRGIVACQFYPEGYVDATLIHLEDLSGHVMTLFFNPLTGQVSILDGDRTLAQVMRN